MLQSFSWSEYFIVVLVLAGIYYCVILLVYYKNEIRHFLNHGIARGRINPRSANQPVSQSTSEVNGDPDILIHESGDNWTAQEQAQNFISNHWQSASDVLKRELLEPENSRLFTFVHELMDEIGKVLKTAAHKHYVKEELIKALQMKVSEYPMLLDTPFEYYINDFVANESSKACSVSLEDNELDRMWKKGR